ncbi:DUF2145 domain-containing protein [Paucimonas lemoignei]|nr:DUF2145 domain-containing protein [Paucimonas lemoignei]
MHTWKTRFAVTILSIGMLAPLAAHAGRSCEENKPTTETIERGLTLAVQTTKELDASGQDVVLLARKGQDLSKHGVQYSHLGFAYRQPDGNGGYSWRVLHKLNHCGTGVAAIYRQGLAEFYLDDLWRYEAAYVVPKPEIQKRLLALFADIGHATCLNQRQYSLVSYAWGQKYQQSNQWALETLAMAISSEVNSREEAQEWLQSQGYRPTAIRLGPLTRLGARISKANVAFDDHPPSKRFADVIETVTADSVFIWMNNANLGSQAVIIRPRR